MQLTTLPPITAFLRKLEGVANLTPMERQAILDLPIQTQTLEPETSVSANRDYAGHCCLILKGCLYRYQLLSRGRRQILGFYIPGDVPNLDGLHLARQDDGLISLGETTVVLMRHRDLHDIIAALPDLADAFWRCMLLDASITRTWLVSLGRRTAPERVAHFFCELYVRLEAVGLAAAQQCPLPMSQLFLGDMLNISAVHVNRTLQNMRKQDLITLRGKVLTICDWDKLVRIAEFDPTYLRVRF